MLKKIVILCIILLIFPTANALCGDYICEKNENSENCCIDCGCSFGEECYENECVKSITAFSFSSEISIFLLILIVILASFVIGYGLNIVIKAHKKTDEHIESKKEEKLPNIDELITPGDIRAKIIKSIKEGKNVKEIKKELYTENINPDLADNLLTEVIDSLIAKSEQGLLSVDWDPRIIECVFREVMKKPVTHRKKKKLFHFKEKSIEKPKERLKEVIKKEKSQKSLRKELVTEVEKYIGIALARGYTTEVIKKNLMKEGWHPEEIQKILDDIIKRGH